MGLGPNPQQNAFLIASSVVPVPLGLVKSQRVRVLQTDHNRAFVHLESDAGCGWPPIAGFL